MDPGEVKRRDDGSHRGAGVRSCVDMRIGKVLSVRYAQSDEHAKRNVRKMKQRNTHDRPSVS